MDVAFTVESAEPFVPERAFAGDGDGWVQGHLARPLELTLRYGSDAEATSEATMFGRNARRPGCWGRTSTGRSRAPPPRFGVSRG